jgi:hypothetical protein
MPVTPFLDGRRFDPETRRVMGVAFEAVCAELRIEDYSGPAASSVASKIIELVAPGETDPDRLCERALDDLRSVPPQT